MNRPELWLAALAIVPWAVVALALVLRGYSFSAWREQNRHRKADDDDSDT